MNGSARKIDATEDERRFDADFPLDTPYNVAKFLLSYAGIKATVDARSVAAVEALVDIDGAWDSASLTVQEHANLSLIAQRGFTFEEAGLELAIPTPISKALFQRSVDKIYAALNKPRR